MLRPNWALAALLGICWLGLAACTSSGEVVAPTTTTSTTTTTTTTVAPDRPDTIRIGVAINEDAPTAAFDAQIEAILREAALATGAETGISIDLRPVSINSPGQAEGSMLSLINDGVNVVITGCDDATIPSVVQAATSNELLAVTGCVSLPRPDIDRLSSQIDSDLFIDLSALNDNARAIASHAQAEGLTSLAVVRSTLLPDVDRACLNLRDELTPDPAVDTNSEDEEVDETGADLVVSIVAETSFVELVDAPETAVSSLLGALGGNVDPVESGPDAIVVCALPPTLGDVVSELRAQGFEQPVFVPWYGDGQAWGDGTSDVFIVTPASRYGDDPAPLATSLFDVLTMDGEQPDAVDIVTADTLSILSEAAARAGSVGSQRIADAIAAGDVSAPISGISGRLAVGGEDPAPVRREYRVIEIAEGVPAFVAIASAVEAVTEGEG